MLIKKVYNKIFNKSDKPRFLNKCEEFSRYEIGDWSFGYLKVFASDEAKLKIGRFSTFASGFTIMLGGEHRPDWVTTYPFISQLFPEALKFKGHPHSRGDVIIGNDVWVALDTLILSGVNIGDGAVIGARSVVRRDIPPYGLFIGNRLIGFRFEKQVIEDLCKIAWWNWPIEKIKEAWPLLLSQDVNAFIETYKK